MKVLFDHLCFNEKYGGVSKYFVEVMKKLPKKSFKLSLLFSNNSSIIENNSFFNVKPFLSNISFKGKPRLERLINKPNTIINILKENYDVYHQTHYDTYAYKYISKKKHIVTTIHDLNYIKIPQFYTNSKNKAQMEESIYKSDSIVTISNNTKKDLLENYNINENKIHVIYHGVNKNEFKKVDAVKNLSFILYVGSRSSYKNFSNVLHALSLINNKDICLVCTGTCFTKNEMKLFESMNLSNRIIHVSCKENELAFLYNNALCFIYPSYYEGFGLPLLEAMTYRCPIACSNTSCFPEIAENAALFFNPNNPNEIAESIVELCSNTVLRNSLIELGEKRVDFFSWDKSSNEHYKFYNSI